MMVKGLLANILSMIQLPPVFLAPQDEKKKFDRASERYYQALEKHLSISSKKKEFTLNEASPPRVE